VSVFREDAPLLMEKAALLRVWISIAASEGHGALAAEQRPACLVHRKQRCGAAGMNADRRAAKIEEICDAKRDIVLLVTDFGCELAGEGQQLRMSNHVGGVVVIVARSGKYADTSVVSFLIVSSVFKASCASSRKTRCCGSMMRASSGPMPKERRIEQVGAFNQTTRAYVVWISAQVVFDAWPQLLSLEERDGLDRLAEIAPELAGVGGAREAAAHANNGNRLAMCPRSCLHAAFAVQLQSRNRAAPLFPSSNSASFAMVGWLKDLDRRISRPKRAWNWRTMRTAASELPPSSKKLSSIPISSSCSSSHHRLANCFSHLSPGRDKVLRKQRASILRRGKRLPIPLLNWA